MNPEESFCRSYLNQITCFESEIPSNYNSSQKTKDYCSFIFPPGYSIYIEEFVLEDPGPNNFVLLDEKPLEFTYELKWADRLNVLWDSLKNGHPLAEKSNRRSNFQCVESLKVKISKFHFYN